MRTFFCFAGPKWAICQFHTIFFGIPPHYRNIAKCYTIVTGYGFTKHLKKELQLQLIRNRKWQKFKKSKKIVKPEMNKIFNLLNKTQFYSFLIRSLRRIDLIFFEKCFVLHICCAYRWCWLVVMVAKVALWFGRSRRVAQNRNRKREKSTHCWLARFPGRHFRQVSLNLKISQASMTIADLFASIRPNFRFLFLIS